MRVATFLSIYSLLLAGCAAGIHRPDMNIYFMNVPAHQMQGNNILHDYDNDGTRTANDFTVYRPLEKIGDVDRLFCTDMPGIKQAKISLADAREYIKNHCSCK